jgi:signal transduction histidine kinase
MKKVALVFLLAVIAPSLVLAWLAGRSLSDQAYVLDRQQTLLYQHLADTQARAVVEQLDKAQREFAYKVEALLKGMAPSNTAPRFDAVLRQEWPLAEVGFVVSLQGQVLAPSLLGGAPARQFRVENEKFLCSAETCAVYWNSPKGLINLATLDQADAMAGLKAGRTVTPAKETTPDSGYSKLTLGEVNFRKLVGAEADGAFARFLQDKLHVMFWHRSADDPTLLFGVQLNLARLTEELRPFVQLTGDLQREVCLALLDNTGRPVALSHPDFQPQAEPGLANRDAPVRPDHFKLSNGPERRTGGWSTVTMTGPVSSAHQRNLWKHPFVAAEIGEILPHWEFAVYLLDPIRLAQSARTLGWTLGLLVSLLLLAIAVGSWLIIVDLRRQLTLARQKTDFVSNVSHELKTPLTSIRMFSEMLAEDRVNDDAKRRQFLGIITAEAARLTRLINNVLDFARLERGEKQYSFCSCPAVALVRETVESYRPHLEANGFVFQVSLPSSDGVLHADRDAIAQVLVNLLSNAEKYSGGRKEIEVRMEIDPTHARITVLDRGLGVPRGAEERIFEQFHRAHDSLASGIEGSGLGLTLARQIARQHGGDVCYAPREGGGSAFCLRLPLAADRDALAHNTPPPPPPPSSSSRGQPLPPTARPSPPPPSNSPPRPA